MPITLNTVINPLPAMTSTLPSGFPKKIIFSSSGIKTAALPDGKDIYLDCRVLFDPTRGKGAAATPGGKHLSTQEAIKYASHVALNAMGSLVKAGASTLANRRGNGSSKPKDVMTVHCFCAWGVHRSVAAKYILAEAFEDWGYEVEVV